MPRAKLHQGWMQRLWSQSWMESPLDQQGRADVHDPVVAETDEEIHKQVWEAAVQARVTCMHVNLHVTDWVATQWEDPVLKVWLNGFPIRKYKIWSIFWEMTQTLRTLYQEALYHHHTLASGLEEVMLFIIPMAHQVASMNRCHRDAGHQDQQWMLYLLHGPVLLAQHGHADTGD